MYQNDNNIETAASDAAYALIPQLEYQLAVLGDFIGWPESVMSQLSVVYEDGKLVVVNPPALNKTIDDLEYGSENTPPKPLLRSFSYRADEAIRRVLGNNTLDVLLDLQEVF